MKTVLAGNKDKKMISSLDSSFIQSNGINLHVVQAGPEDGQPVLLLHGYPEYWRGWEKQILPLAQSGFRVIVPDQRGYNLSEKPRDLSTYRMDVLAGDVVGLMDALQVPKAIVVGHDWGGAIAWITAVLHPERVEKLAVLNAPYPPVFARTFLRHPEQLLRSMYIYFFQLPGLPEAILRNRNWELAVRAMQNSSRPGTFNEEDFNHYREAWWRKDAMTSMLNWYRASLRRPLRLPLSPRITLPVLLLWGVKDVALGRELAEASIRLCENGRLVYFEEATHWLQHEEPEAVLAQMNGFFQRWF